MKRQQGFTLIEILTVLAILGILMALLLPTTVNVHGYALQTPCMNNLHQIGLAFNMYLEDYGRRPVELSDLAVAGYVTPEVLICPADPTGDYGGLACRQNRGGPSNCPAVPAVYPTSYSYLSLRRKDDLWARMEALGSRGSYAVCQVHGRRRGMYPKPDLIPWYEGKVLRLSFDGSVHMGHTHWTHGHNWQEVWSIWKIFTDEPPPPPFSDSPGLPG